MNTFHKNIPVTRAFRLVFLGSSESEEAESEPEERERDLLTLYLRRLPNNNITYLGLTARRCQLILSFDTLNITEANKNKSKPCSYLVKIKTTKQMFFLNVSSCAFFIFLNMVFINLDCGRLTNWNIFQKKNCFNPSYSTQRYCNQG